MTTASLFMKFLIVCNSHSFSKHYLVPTLLSHHAVLLGTNMLPIGKQIFISAESYPNILVLDVSENKYIAEAFFLSAAVSMDYSNFLIWRTCL